MVTANGIYGNGSSNGVYARELYPACPSDYEAVPIDAPPQPTPKLGWRDQFPQFTHNVSWTDGDGLSHSMTLRSDDLQGLMADLRLVKSIVKAARQQAAAAKAPQPAQQADSATQEQATDLPDVQQCRIHAVDMVRRWSKRTQGHYFGHKLPGGDFCYGRPLKA